MRSVTLYTSPGCCLCDAAREVLLRIRQTIAFKLIERDITHDDELYRRYLERIPVVAIDDVIVCEFEVDEGVFVSKLQSSMPVEMIEN